MKRTFLILLAVLLFASPSLLAQEPTSGTDPMQSTQTTTTTTTLTKYYLHEAYPIMKKLENQPIYLIGKAERNAKIGIWITLVDGAYKIPVVKTFKTLTSTTIFGKQVMLTGAFTYDAKSGWRFGATAVKVL